MLSKLYFLLFVAATIVMSILTFTAHRQLQSVGFSPAQIADNFGYWDNIGWQFLWLSSLGLLVIANILLWKTKKSWALWTTLLYFAGFILIQTWILGDLFADYRSQNRLAQEGFSAPGLIGALLCVVAATVIFFDQFLVSRLQEKMYGSKALPQNVSTEETAALPENVIIQKDAQAEEVEPPPAKADIT